MKVLGFIGTEKYDVILYLSIFLKELGKKVAMVDLSEDRALATAVPFSAEVDTCYFRDSVFYNHVDAIEDIVEDVDYVLIDFGFSVKHDLIAACNEIYLVTDTQFYHNKLLKNTVLAEDQARYLLVRCFFNNKRINDVTIMDLKSLFITSRNTFSFHDYDTDYQNMIKCQNGLINFKRISPDLKEFLMIVVATDFDEKTLRATLKKLERTVKR